MYKKFSLVFSILMIVVLGVSAGYVGEIPDIYENFKEERKQNAEEMELKAPPVPKLEDVLPLAPNKMPDKYSNIIIKKGKYNSFKKEVEDIIPTIEKIKVNIEENVSLQRFNASTKSLELKVNNLLRKYKNKPQTNNEIILMLSRLNLSAMDLSQYWANSNKQKKYVSNSESAYSYSEETILESKMKLLNQIKDTLITIEESTY